MMGKDEPEPYCVFISLPSRRNRTILAVHINTGAAETLMV
jgi:hypothetical protein